MFADVLTADRKQRETLDDTAATQENEATATTTAKLICFFGVNHCVRMT